MSGYSLALAFDTDSPEFAHGVEVGRLWEMLRAAPDEWHEAMLHVANAEMLIRVAEALGRGYTAVEHDDTWMTVNFGPEGSLHDEGPNV